jgi:hypothetical protein
MEKLTEIILRMDAEPGIATSSLSFCCEGIKYATDTNEDCVLQNPSSTKQYFLPALQDIPLKQFAFHCIEKKETQLML